MSKKNILNITERLTSNCTLNYKEEFDEEKNKVIIESKMEFDLSSKSAKNRLNNAWKKDKSPLLVELQKKFREHEKNKKEEKERNWYEPIE